MAGTTSPAAVPDKPRPSVAKLVRARIECGLTQEELAREADISLASISKYERGVRTPTGPKLRRIAEATGRDVGWFFDHEEEAA